MKIMLGITRFLFVRFFRKADMNKKGPQPALNRKHGAVRRGVTATCERR